MSLPRTFVFGGVCMTTSTWVNQNTAPATDAGTGKGRSLTAGFSDGIGDRQLMFDPTAATSFELLHIKKDLADIPEFEAALRARVEEVRNVQHPSLSTIHNVERRADGALLLASKLVSGRRVAALVPKARGAACASELLRLITPALAVLHKSSDRVAHGALTPDRIIVTRDGRLMIVEHVLGSALEAAKLSRARLNDMGLPVPVGDHVHFDGRSDMGQLGFIALSLLLGRQLDPADFPVGVPALLDEFVMSSNSPMLSAKMRAWLERAMQLSPRSFASAKEASDALSELPDDADVRASEATVAANSGAPVPTPPSSGKSSKSSFVSAPAIAPASSERSRRETPDFLPAQTSSSGGGSILTSRWVTMALAALVVIEGGAIAYLLSTRQTQPAVSSRPASQLASVAPHQTPVVPSPSPAAPAATVPPIAIPSPTPAASPVTQ